MPRVALVPMSQAASPAPVPGLSPYRQRPAPSHMAGGVTPTRLSMDTSSTPGKHMDYSPSPSPPARNQNTSGSMSPGRGLNRPHAASAKLGREKGVQGGRCPTFVVDADSQRESLERLQKREQHFSESYSSTGPLCFNAKSFQKTHPTKAKKGDPDADACLCSPMLVAVADGVSQIEEFGIDASELPNALLHSLEELAVQQLLPGQETSEYNGPVAMMRDAYESTKSLGSTTILTAVMDNSTKIHGKRHPMIAVCSIGDCEICILRRVYDGRLLPVFNTEMQRIDGNAQSPLQLARVDETVDPSFDEALALEVIEHGSAVHCVSAALGDIVVLGSDGLFDNLFIEDIVETCEGMIPHKPSGQQFQPLNRHLLGEVARCLVNEAHQKTTPMNGRWRDTPIGAGGKCDDTCCVVGQVVEWREEYGEAWEATRNRQWWQNAFTCNGVFGPCEKESEPQRGHGTRPQQYPSKPNADSFSTYWGSFSLKDGGDGYSSEYTPRDDYRSEHHQKGCSVM